MYSFKPFFFNVIKDCPWRPRNSCEADKYYPRPRSGHRLVYYKDCLYSFGGYNPSVGNSYVDEVWEETEPLFQELWKFNTINGVWTRMPQHEKMPMELASHAALQFGASMLVFGGTSIPFGGSSSNTVSLCHLPTGQWQELETIGAPPEPLYGQGVCFGDNCMYTIGGTDGYTYRMTVHRLCFNSLTWEYLVPGWKNGSNYEPENRYRHEIIENRGSLLVFGGGKSDEVYDLQYLPTFSVQERIWTSTPTKPDPCSGESYPRSRRCHVVVRSEKYVYIQGGFDGGTAFSDLWRIHLDAFEWEKLPFESPFPLYFHAAALAQDNCLYLFGGVKEPEKVRSGQVLKVWLHVCKLQDMCWQALCFYNPRLPNFDRVTLLQMGIPAAYVRALQQFPAVG